MKKGEMVPAMDSGAILKSAMKERSIVQVDLADKLGVLQSAVSGNINRKRMSLDVFSTMLDAMDFDVAVVDRESGEVMWRVEVK